MSSKKPSWDCCTRFCHFHFLFPLDKSISVWPLNSTCEKFKESWWAHHCVRKGKSWVHGVSSFAKMPCSVPDVIWRSKLISYLTRSVGMISNTCTRSILRFQHRSFPIRMHMCMCGQSEMDFFWAPQKKIHFTVQWKL